MGERRPRRPRNRAAPPGTAGTAGELLETAAGLHRAGDLEGAKALYRQVLDGDAGHPDALHLLGVLASQQGEHERALELIARAIARRGDAAPFHASLGQVHSRLGRAREAEAACRTALRLDPGLHDARLRLGNLLRERGDDAAAEACFREVLAARPGDEQARVNLGVTLRAQGRLDEAIAEYRAALAGHPGLALAHCNLGNALQAKHDLPGAIAAYREAVRVEPEYADAHLNLALALLARGEFDEGWREYEWRWRSPGALKWNAVRRDFPEPAWDGGDIAGRRLLLQCEQGLGDAMQFARFIGAAAARGATVILECQPELERLLATCRGVTEVVARGSPLPPFDAHCPLLSLPRVLGAAARPIPAEVPYLAADAPTRERWRARLDAGPAGLRVGLAWAGISEHANDRNRSLPLAALAPLAAAKDAVFYSLQKGPAATQGRAPPAGLRLVDLTGELADFAETAALAAELDLVISVDTAVAHLAGALGKPVWTLIPYVPDWRWQLAREDSPWYPTMRLFRQDAARDWSQPVARAAAALAAIAGTGAAQVAAAPERDPVALLNEAFGQYRSGNHPAAEALATRAVALAPASADLLGLLAALCLARRDFAGGEIWARQALRHAPGSARQHVSLGYALRSQGRLDEAIDSFRRAVDLEPQYAEGWHRLAQALRAAGDRAQAQAAVERALVIDPGYPAAWCTAGHLLADQGRAQAAADAYREAAARDPASAEARVGLGTALQALGRTEEAVAAHREALRLRPDLPEAHNNLGNALKATGRIEDALSHYDEALRARPGYHEALLNRGLALQEAGRHEDAIPSFEAAIAARPGNALAHMALGTAWQDRGKLGEAERCYREALRLDPDYAEASSNLGVALQELGRLDEALACHERALALKPGDPDVLVNYGVTLKECGRLDDAIARYEEALRARPGFEGGLINLGAALNEQGRLPEALEAYHRAVAENPGSPEAHWNNSLALLLKGDYERGWLEYEWRWQSETARRARVKKPSFPEPQWDGGEFPGERRILLIAEQGYGDAIQFARYAPLIARRGARVTVQCHRELARLLRGLDGVESIVPLGAPPPPVDTWIPMLSLALAFGTRADSIPAAVPYLEAEADRVARWRGMLAADPARLKVGLVWAGRAEHRNDRNRSATLAQFAPLARVEGVSFYSLQKGTPAAAAAEPPPGMCLHDVSGMLEDFADTAALVTVLDLVITVDTAVLHLAGALGRPAWALIPFAPDWRWFLEREDSPWYPTVRLIRQPRPRDWAPVIERVAEALAALAATRQPAVAAAPPAPLLGHGIAAHRAGRLDEAAAVYAGLLARDPRHADALHLTGVIATQRGRNDEAEIRIRHALEVNPRAPEYWNSLGNVLRQLERAMEAGEAYREAIRLKPGYAEAHNNLGLLLKAAGDPEGAYTAIREALRLQPAYAEGHVNLGNTLQALARYEESLASYEEALRLRPRYPEALMNLGNALQRLGRLTEAVARTRQAIEERPDYTDAHMNLGQALQSQGRVPDALSCYRAALSMRPDYPEAHWNYALALLLSGELREGFREYEWRWRWKDFPSPPRDFTQPQWRGEDIAGTVILLHAEQVFGDTIQFIRYAPLVAARGAEVVVECQPELVRLFSAVPGIHRLVARGATLPRFDRHCPLMSLPLAFGHDLGALPREVPYLAAEPERVAAWRERLGGGFHAGIVWAGSPHHKNDRNRSLPLAAFAPLAIVPGVSFVSLQKGAPARQGANPPGGMRLADFTAELNDFADTATLVASLDLVICADTAVAHLAGALGVPVWILLPCAPDWRWLLEREDSPWYPTARLFRQRQWGDWDEVLERVAGALAGFVGRPAAAAKAPSAAALVTEAARRHQGGDPAAAIPLYRRALALDTGCADAWHLLGVALRQSKRHAEAARCIRRALGLQPHGAAYHASLGNVLKDEARYEEAVASYREALRLKPDHAEAHYNLGTALHHLKRAAEAEAHFRAAIRHNPAFAEAWYNLGNVLQDRDALDEAQPCYERAIELKPGDARAHSNLGTIHVQRGEPHAAIRAFESAVAAEPGNPDAHWNLSLALLLTGDFARGWPEYEWRWRTADGRRLERRFPHPRYAGEDPRGRRILLHAEQGLGDAIQFVRYAAVLAERGATILVESRPETARLFTRAAGVAEVVVAGAPLPAFDLHCPLLTLPLALGTTLAAVPATVPYVTADPSLTEAWRGRLAAGGTGLRVGLAWAGRPEHPHDRWRSIPFPLLSPVFAVPGIAWHSLQKPPAGRDERLADDTRFLTDFADTAAFISNLDLVITVDTSVAHLAGALGKRVWVLLPHAPDWRWMLEREESVWYPTMTLLRQPRTGDWPSVIERTAQRLARFRETETRA
ncbi:MAG: tetratricopeptide repeat protein [Burkholderiales bacterium]|nr:tetratricopeptide repeat protein [Burkholderiales bacterium]